MLELPSAARPRIRRGRTAALAVTASAALTLTLAPAALAAAFVDVQANKPQVATDPSSDVSARFPTNSRTSRRSPSAPTRRT